MAGEGQLLRAAREAKKWSLLETEDLTKIRVRYIQALEEEDYEILPGLTYTKGYLRTYAKHLGLNPDEIINLYNQSITPEIEAKPIPDVPQSEMLKYRPRWFKSVGVGIAAVLAIIVIVVFLGWKSPEKKLADSSYSAPPLPSAPKTETSVSHPSTSVSASTSESSSATSTPKSPGTPPDVAAATQEGLTAQLVFTQPCWIEIKVDGQPSVQGTFAAGTTKVIKGNSKIELVTVGNAGGVSITLNGKAYPSIGTSGEVVRNVVFTLDTLKTL